MTQEILFEENKRPEFCCWASWDCDSTGVEAMARDNFNAHAGVVDGDRLTEKAQTAYLAAPDGSPAESMYKFIRDAFAPWNDL